jgi:amino acid adenylation domain-containing protein
MDNGMSGSVGSFQMSPQQARVWAGEPDGPTARVQAVLSIDGPLEPAVLADALRASVARHEILRTTFAAQAGLRVPLQDVAERLDPHVETLAVEADVGAERERLLAEVRAAELAVPLNPNQGPLVRASILEGGGEVFALVLTISALCADIGSLALVLGEVADVLASAELVQDPLQYADFAAWQHELSESEDEEATAARAFWSEAGSASTPALPFVRPGCSPARDEVKVALDDAVAQGLHEQTTRYGAEPATVVQAAWHAVLGRYSGEEETLCAYLAGGRRHGDLEGALGTFAQAVPVAVRVVTSRTFAEALADVTQSRELALVRQDYAPAESGGLDVGFADYPLALAQPEGLRLRIESMLCTEPELRLLAMCGTDGERIAMSLTFDPVRYGRETVEGLAEGVSRVLAAVAADPSAALGGIDLLSERARTRVLHEFNDTAATVPAECVQELFAQHARSAPERTAVSDGERSLTYGELDASANRLARRLRAVGVGPDVAVGLCTNRSVEMIVGLLGILKAGGAYVPLHYEHPPARLCSQLAAAGARTVVTQGALAERLGDFEGDLVCLDRDREAIERESSEPLDAEAGHEDRAYVIFTSGSTGAPKGVEVTHGNLANYAWDIVRRLGADTEPLAFGLVTSISTDLGNTSVFGALCSGGTLVLVSPAAAGDPGALARLMEATSVDVLKITPSHLGALLAAGDAGVLPRRWLVLGGERADWDLIERVRGIGSGCAILNHYGPTETTVGSCTFAVLEGPGEYAPASVPIGRPISNTRCYVVDAGGAPAPVGVSGRLLIGGAGVARGYVGEPALTAERFFADPFTVDERARVYDTGDLARWLPDGTLEFMGRIDEQVKIRGYRVEPAEVDSALRRHPGVSEAITVAHAVPGGEVRLIAYCTVDDSVEEAGLRAHLAEWLPEYMLPGAIVVVEELPRTPSGKIDRLALPDPDLVSADGADYVAPRTPLEEAVAAIWAQVLGVPRVGAEDDFFALGGHSLLATQVVAQVRSDFAVELPLHSLFTYPTVTSLAAEIVGMMSDAEGDETTRLMAELEGMSDEEAERLLAEDLQPEAGQG